MERDRTDKNFNLQTLIENHDYAEALGLLKANSTDGSAKVTDKLWQAFCYFHLNSIVKAAEIYQSVLNEYDHPEKIQLCLACCSMFLGQYQEAIDYAKKGGECSLVHRILAHVYQELDQEDQVDMQLMKLSDSVEDQLCVASIHFRRRSYQEAIDIYKRILLQHMDFLAINVYLAICYYKSDYFDVSLEVLKMYLARYPDSFIAVNLKACTLYKLFDGKRAYNELKTFYDRSTMSSDFARDILEHNLALFDGGEDALKVLSKLVKVIPEARINLAIARLRHGDPEDALNLVKNVTPENLTGYIVKAVACYLLATKNGNQVHLADSLKYFQTIGESPTECDTIPGRQCMASAYFLLNQFEDALLYLDSIKTYFIDDDVFNFNYGQIQVMLRNYEDAEITGQFHHSLLAFDSLQKRCPTEDFWDARRGACAGIFRLFIAGKVPVDCLNLAVNVLQDSNADDAAKMLAIIKKRLKFIQSPIFE